MKKWLFPVAALALAGSMAVHAQTPAVSPANILDIETINIKPYQDGPFDRVASEYPALSEKLKDPTHVLGMEALTGSPRAIYISGFDSYEALQKSEEWLLGDSATDAKIDALDAREALYISEVNHTLWHYRPDLSNNVAGADIPHSHFWEVIVFHMRSGHGEQFDELTKLHRDANLKIGQNTPWAAYEGLTSVTNDYLILVPMKSLKDQDAGLAHKKDFGDALGDAGRGRMSQLSAESVASVEDNLWMVNPEWSYVEKSWIEADPQYWAPPEPSAKLTPKPAAGAAAKPKAPSAP
jgi:hypothetical protein